MSSGPVELPTITLGLLHTCIERVRRQNQEGGIKLQRHEVLKPRVNGIVYERDNKTFTTKYERILRYSWDSDDIRRYLDEVVVAMPEFVECEVDTQGGPPRLSVRRIEDAAEPFGHRHHRGRRTRPRGDSAGPGGGPPRRSTHGAGEVQGKGLDQRAVHGGRGRRIRRRPDAQEAQAVGLRGGAVGRPVGKPLLGGPGHQHPRRDTRIRVSCPARPTSSRNGSSTCPRYCASSCLGAVKHSKYTALTSHSFRMFPMPGTINLGGGGGSVPGIPVHDPPHRRRASGQVLQGDDRHLAAGPVLQSQGAH